MHTSVLSLLAAAGTGGTPPVWLSYLPFVAMGLIFWFLILRPQMKQQKTHRAKLEAIKKGDEVLTGGGFVGKVIRVEENYVDVELAPGEGGQVDHLRRDPARRLQARERLI
jgi:preprotein translocase subunit YajC